jgi:hypothetical protein
MNISSMRYAKLQRKGRVRKIRYSFEDNLELLFAINSAARVQYTASTTDKKRRGGGGPASVINENEDLKGMQILTIRHLNNCEAHSF